MPISVPYFSQWSDPNWNEAIINGANACEDPTWTKTGFTNQEQYEFWSWRICGLACLRSILETRDGACPAPSELLKAALKQGVYKTLQDGSVLGLIYRPFCDWVENEFGVGAVVLENIDLRQALTTRGVNEFLMLSVSPEIRTPIKTPAKKGGHLVLVYDHNDQLVTFHNPSGVADNMFDVSLDHITFQKFFAGRGIKITM